MSEFHTERARHCFAEARARLQSARDVLTVARTSPGLPALQAFCAEELAHSLAGALWFRDTAREWRRMGRAVDARAKSRAA